MKKRILAFLLALLMTAGCVPSAWATGESRMAVAVSTGDSTVIAPQYVACRDGETVWQVLSRMEGHTFTQAESGFISAVDGVVANFNRFDDRGGYDLEQPAATTAAFVLTEAEIGDAASYCAMVCAMADYSEASAPVQRYAAAEYQAADAALRTADADHRALGQTLLAKMEAYEKEVVSGDKAVLRLTFADITGAPLATYSFTAVNAYGTEFTFSDADTIALTPGIYDFCAESDFNGARGTMTVEADGTVSVQGSETDRLMLPCGTQWLEMPILHRTSGELEGDTYIADNMAESHRAVCYVPDACTGTYLYTAPGSGLKDGTAYSTDTVRWAARYTDVDGAAREKANAPWQSKAAALTGLLAASPSGNTVTVEAQYTALGYTSYQQYTLDVLRTPTLARLDVLSQGVATNIGFQPEKDSYVCSVTSDTVELKPSAFDTEGYAVYVSGTLLPAGQTFSVPLTEKSTVIPVTVTSGSEERTYTLTVHRVQAVTVELLHDADVTVHVFNGAGAEIGAAEKGDTCDRFDLVPGEAYTYTTDKQTWYHAAGEFTAEQGATVTAQTPETADALESLYLSTGVSAVAGNDRVCLRAAEDVAHAYTVSVSDISANLYCWATGKAYTLTVVETGKAIRQKAATAAGQVLSGFLRAGNATQTLTIRASRSGEGGAELYQDYRITVCKTPTLKNVSGLRLTVEEQETPVFPKGSESAGFDRDVTDYTATIARAAAYALVTLAPYGSDYYVYVNGVRHDMPVDKDTGLRAQEVTVRIPLDSARDTEYVFITVGSAATPAEAERRTYVLALGKKDAVATTFRVADEAGQILHDALLCVYDGRTQKRVWPESDGTFRLVDTLTYTYIATCAGYVGQTADITAGAENAAIAVCMKKAPESIHGAGVSSTWSSFRGSDSSNGVTAAKTPVTAQSAVLSWASKLGEGYSSGAVGCPILITEGGYDYLIVYASDTLFKVDALSGETVAVGKMDHSSSFAINSPTFAEGMLFVGLSNGAVQAFDASTLEPLWIYRDALGGQPNCPITYHDGYIYTGFWNNETAQADFVCLSVTDEDPADGAEEKLPAWTYASAGGFYWAGAYVCDDYLLIGTDDGRNGCTSETASLLCIDPATGRLMDAIDGLKGDIRCSIAYDNGRFYFTSKGGYFYSVAAPVKDGGDWLLDEDSLRSVALRNGGDAQHPAMSTCTPVVYNGRAYVGVSGTGQFTPYSGHSITVIDLSSWEIAYSVPTQGYPQTSGLLTTAYEDGKQTVYVYFFDNYTPGKLRVLKDAPGQTQAVLTTKESYTVQEKTTEYDTPYVLFTPADAQAQYAICSPITDGSGRIYFKNDSAHLMALSSTITAMTVTKLPDKTEYVVGEYFDPTGMEISVTYENGTVRTLPVQRTVNDKTIRYFTWKDEPLTTDDGEGFMLRFAYSLYQDGEDGVGTRVNSPPALLALTVKPPASGDVNGDGKLDITDLQNLFSYLSTGAVEGMYQEDISAYLALADVNGDGAVDILDYQALYTAIAAAVGAGEA